MSTNFNELNEAYMNLRGRVLEDAEKRGLIAEFKYEEHREEGIPIGFSGFSIRDTSLFKVLVHGNLDTLKELYEGSAEYDQMMIEVFGPEEGNELAIEKQRSIEDQEDREAA